MSLDAVTERAAAAGLQTVVEELGDWAPVRLLAELDRAAMTIRISARCAAAVERALGTEMLATFMSCAVAHELFHYLVPEASEAQAHAYALRATGTSRRVFEAMLAVC